MNPQREKRDEDEASLILAEKAAGYPDFGV